jgi:hypothetical protein
MTASPLSRAGWQGRKGAGSRRNKLSRFREAFLRHVLFQQHMEAVKIYMPFIIHAKIFSIFKKEEQDA